MSKEKEIAIALMLVDSENLDHILDSIYSPADVDYFIAARKECGKGQKAENMINVDMGLTKDSVDTVFEVVEGKLDNYYTETTITGNSNSEEEVPIQNIEEGNITVDSHVELDLWEPE